MFFYEKEKAEQPYLIRGVQLFCGEKILHIPAAYLLKQKILYENLTP